MLTDIAAKKAKGKDRAYKLHDSAGLYLYVSKTGSKHWRIDYREAGKRQTASLGRYPELTLAEARKARDDLKARLEGGRSPGRFTFGQIADEYLARERDRGLSDASLKRSERLLTKTVGGLREKEIRQITPADVLALLERLSATDRRETAHRTRAAVSAVYRFAIATLRAENDPTYVLKGAVPPPKVQHMPAITDERQFGHLMSSIEQSTGWWSVRSYLTFLALTFCRPGEARLAMWDEIEGDVWRIPASRMKMRRAHEVPLSRQALEVLRFARAADPHSPLLFPSLRSNRKPLSENAANSALRKMGFEPNQMVSHGFRSSASTILNRRGFDREVIEMQLAHAPEDRIRAIYNRHDLWSERVRLMQKWADLIDAFKMI